MAFQPMRKAWGSTFTDALDPNLNNELVGRMAQAGLGAIADRRANKIELDAWANLQRAGGGGGGGFGIGDALSLAAGGLSAAKGLGLFGGGGGGLSFGKAAKMDFKMPDYMGGAGNFGSFWGN